MNYMGMHADVLWLYDRLPNVNIVKEFFHKLVEKYKKHHYLTLLVHNIQCS